MTFLIIFRRFKAPHAPLLILCLPSLDLISFDTLQHDAAPRTGDPPKWIYGIDGTIQGHQLVKLKQLEMMFFFFPQRIMTTCDWWLYVLWYVSTENRVSSNQNINEVHNQLELNAWQTQSSGWSPDCPSSRVLWNISIPAMVAFMGFSWHTGGRFKDAWCSQIYSEGIIAKIMHCCQWRTLSAIPLRLAFG